MDLQNLSDVHSGRYTQWIQYDIQRSSVWQEWHIFDWQDTGNNTLVTMSAGHFITYRDFSLLCDINTNALIYSRRKFVSIFSCEDLCIHNNTVCTVWYTK